MAEEGLSNSDLELKLCNQSIDLLTLRTNFNDLQANFNNLQIKFIEKKEKTFNLERKNFLLKMN
uniref:Uncharacterized protein n=1 Tax=Meloidogyne enterolobii TaxID=390850 RepID=A0A6V7XWP1_MELEN|nr:unnamed protein product [Meloidogyne enterolobii]